MDARRAAAAAWRRFSMTGNAISETRARAAGRPARRRAVDAAVWPLDPPRRHRPRAAASTLAGIDASRSRRDLDADSAASLPAHRGIEQLGGERHEDRHRQAAPRQRSAPEPSRIRRCGTSRTSSAPGWNVIGAGEPGVPGVAAGHNERDRLRLHHRRAWTSRTSTWRAIAAVSRGHGTAARGRALLPEPRRAGSRSDGRRHAFRVKGEAPRVTVLEFSEHGPIVGEDTAQQRGPSPCASSGTEPGTAGYMASLSLDRAKDWPDSSTAATALAAAHREPRSTPTWTGTSAGWRRD